MPIVDALVQAAHPLADGLVVDLQEVREVRRPHVEALVRGAEKIPELPIGEVRVLERRRVAVELLPVLLEDQRLELFEHRSARIWGQDLELRECRSEVRRVIDRRRNRIPVVLQESENIKRRSNDPSLAAMVDDLALMRLWNRPPA